MPEHSLSFGKQIIEGLCHLGRALAYHVETELPIERDRITPQAVDIGWLSEPGQRFPLMIFEVESTVTSSVANNPVKVFGKPNTSFEKPLFFFHVMASGGEETSRIDDLTRLFGTHNYRTYRLASKETTILVKDVLSQHRRLTSRIDLCAVVSALSTGLWPHLDLDSVVAHIESVGFEQGRGTFLPRYAELSKKDPRFRGHFIRYLERRENARQPISETDTYPTYVGSQWSVPIHLGILASSSSGNCRAYFDRLTQWQENTWYLTQIGPHFGLSKDYDDFVVGLAPSLWALIAALMRAVPEAAEYIAEQCKEVLVSLEAASTSYSFFTALWMLHISASSHLSLAHFDYARDFINERGGIPKRQLYYPIGILNLEHPSDWLSDEADGHVYVPPGQEFRSSMNQVYGSTDGRDGISLAMDALMDEDTVLEWGAAIAGLLSQAAPWPRHS